MKSFKYLNMIELREINFAKDRDMKEIDGFNIAYGDINKMFKLPKNTYKTLYGLFVKMGMQVRKIAKKWKENRVDTLVEIFRLNRTLRNEGDCSDSLMMYNFICLVHEHYTMNHSMSHYSRLLGVPAKRISEKFKTLGVNPPHTLIKQRIISEVKRQLLYTNKTVKLICFDVGFNDPAYFSRFFKKNTGMSTTQFIVHYNQQLTGVG